MFIDEVAVIDEIQMIRDPSRGWAWTRALLGLYNILRNVIIIIIMFKPKLLLLFCAFVQVSVQRRSMCVGNLQP